MYIQSSLIHSFLIIWVPRLWIKNRHKFDGQYFHRFAVDFWCLVSMVESIDLFLSAAGPKVSQPLTTPHRWPGVVRIRPASCTRSRNVRISSVRRRCHETMGELEDHFLYIKMELFGDENWGCKWVSNFLSCVQMMYGLILHETCTDILNRDPFPNLMTQILCKKCSVL